MMGPSLTFDKSFLEMINPDEMDELDLNFAIFVTPTLVSEIIADLKHPAPREGKLPADIVKALARKMVGGHGITQAHFRKLALGELNQQKVPLTGQIIVDGAAPNVLKTADGKGLVYDSLPHLQMWQRWAEGDFSETDKLKAEEWRAKIADIDIPGIADYWKEFCGKHLSKARNVDDVIREIETQIVDSFSQVEQQSFLWAIYQFLEAPNEACFMSQTLFSAGLIPQIKAWAPYAASIGKLGTILCCCLSLKFVTSRPTNVIDLQYLFYAPFGSVFVSRDKLHRQLWPATQTNGSFVWGEEMKTDLKRYIAAREENASLPEDKRTPYYRQFTREASVIARMRQKYMRFDPRDVPPPKAKTIADLEPYIQEHLRQAEEALDKARGTY
jgi:hypothetical protein